MLEKCVLCLHQKRPFLINNAIFMRFTEYVQTPQAYYIGVVHKIYLPIAPEPKQRESSNIKCIEKVKLQKETIPKDHSDIPFYKNKQTHPYRNALRTVKLQAENIPKRSLWHSILQTVLKLFFCVMLQTVHVFFSLLECWVFKCHFKLANFLLQSLQKPDVIWAWSKERVKFHCFLEDFYIFSLSAEKPTIFSGRIFRLIFEWCVMLGVILLGLEICSQI